MVTNYQETAQYAMAVAAEMQRHDSTNIMPILTDARLDAMSAGHLQEQLTHYSPELIREDYPEYKYAAGVVHLDNREYLRVQPSKKNIITLTSKWERH